MKYLLGIALLFLIVTPAGAQSTPEFTHLTITMKAEGGPCGMVCLENEYKGCCPAYSVSLDETGTVTYNGVFGVKERGESVHSIPLTAVRELVAEFQRINFFSLEDRYTEVKLPNGGTRTVDHSNATTISLDLDGKKKSVYIFYGAPEELTKLQRKLYEVTQIAQYTGR